MKKGKAAGCSGVSADMIKILEESGLDTMIDIIGTVLGRRRDARGLETE